MHYKYAYQGSGHPILTWKNGPPRQTRAGDSVSLGSTLDDPTLVLPRPGAPEPLNGLGCADSYMKTSKPCTGCRGKTGMAGVSESIAALPSGVKIAGAAGLAYLLYKHLKK